MTALTKQTVKRFYEATPTVRTMNGYFQKAAVEAKFARHRFELTVDVTHPSLQCFGDFNSVELVYWTGTGPAAMAYSLIYRKS